MTKADIIKLELNVWSVQFRWGWIGVLVFLGLLFYGVPRVQSQWNVAGIVLSLVMACVFGMLAYRAHRHIQQLLDQLDDA